jgi:uncharacterized protein (TIGR02594 family)
MANFKVTGNLNVRKGPSLGDDVVAVLSTGDVAASLAGFDTVVEVDAPPTSPAGVRTWMRIESDTQPDGWASLKNLTLQADGRYLVTGTAGATIRAEPSRSGAAVVTLSTGELVPQSVMVAEESAPLALPGRRWARLDLSSGKGGWASMKFLTPSTAGPGRAVRDFVVTAAQLNVRAMPSVESDSVGTLAKGVKVPEGDVVITPSHRWMAVVSPAPGFVSMKWLALESAATPGSPQWLVIAMGEVGVKERSGAADNPRIVEYHRSTTLGPQLSSQDETPWCSSFVNWCMERAGIEGTDSAMARSWLKFGKKVTSPVPGDIVVFSRGAPPSGHVGFFIRQSGTDVDILGGNQGDAVSIKEFPTARVIGYRRP